MTIRDRAVAWMAILMLLLAQFAAAETDDSNLPLPIGEPNPASQWMFTGQSYIFDLVDSDDVWNAPNMMNVTFETCARTDWHSHDGGQILIAVGGVGIHQVENQTAELLLPGMVARVEPGVMHWHGAADEGWFQHIAVETNPGQAGFQMGDPVDDDAYRAALADARVEHLNEE